MTSLTGDGLSKGAVDAVRQMADTDQYREVYATEERHPCPVPGCRISAEEHHRIMYGILAENADLRRRVATARS